MTQRIHQTETELRRHLDQQLGFLERSADAFDRGYEDEAKRLAVTIRVLVHDTAKSRSLLSQLAMKDVPFCDSAFPNVPGNLVSYSGLAAIVVGVGPAKHIALLDGAGTKPYPAQSFESWWNAIIFQYDGGRQLSRGKLILAVADQDGGAHVDPALDAGYSRLTREHTLQRWSGSVAGNTPLTGAELVSVRQVAHEVLKTLKPDYQRVRTGQDGTIVSGISATLGPTKAAGT